jgi:prephenate dehydrogenase
MAAAARGFSRASILEVVNNDTWQLFEDMHRFNPYAREKRQDFITAMEQVQGRIKKC